MLAVSYVRMSKMEGFFRGVLILPALLFMAAANKPNIIMIVVDDLGWADVGFRSGDIKTPTIDWLASQGVVLDQYYVQDVCSPSRATFMTGRYAMHHGIVDWIPPGQAYGLPLDETTLAEKMKEAGYYTAASGKWHLGFYKWAYTPTFRGFDSFFGFYSGGEDYFKHQSNGGYDFRRDSSPFCGSNCSQVSWKDEGIYSTTAFTREAVRVIRSHEPSGENPLFLYLAYQGVHAPAEAPESYITPYVDSITDAKRRTFAGMLSAVDEGIGNVTQALASKNMLDNTLVIFTSDNGGPIQGGDAVGARNWPLRGGKHSIWEGGVRATAFVSGAGITQSRRGTEWRGLMHGADWLPTLGEVAGYNLDGTKPLDGVPQWTGISGGGESARNATVLGNSTNLCSWPSGDPRRARHEVRGAAAECGFAIRVEQWKLVQGYGGAPDQTCNTTVRGDKSDCRDFPAAGTACPDGWCLFDIEADANELSECSRDHPQVMERLEGLLARLLDSYTEYVVDKNCPAHKFVNDSHVGKTWAPWCG